MKVRVGMRVVGDVDVGIVVAMSRDWCIYQPKRGEECAEPWDCITLDNDGPEETVSSVSEVELGGAPK